MRLSRISMTKFFVGILVICLSGVVGYAHDDHIEAVQTHYGLSLPNELDKDESVFDDHSFHFDEGLIENNVLSRQNYSYSRVRIRIDSSRNHRLTRTQFRLLLSSKNKTLHSDLKNVLLVTKYFRVVEHSKDYFVFMLRELLI